MIKREWKPKDISEAFFPVEMRPLYMPRKGSTHPHVRLDRHFAVIDVERESPFSVVTDDYDLITNREAYEKSETVMRKVFQVAKLADMKCLNIMMPKTRSFCHIDLVHQATTFEPWKNDSWSAFVRISNSYNRTKKLRYELGFCRWICLNGMIFGKRSVEFSYAHVRRETENIERFIENASEIRKLESQLTENLHQLKRFYVPASEMLAIVCRAFGIKVTRNVLEKPRRIQELLVFRNQVRALTAAYFEEMGSHGYAALNVLTDYASRPEGVISPENVINDLQQRSSSWMEDFIKSIKEASFSFDDYLSEYRETAKIIESPYFDESADLLA